MTRLRFFILWLMGTAAFSAAAPRETEAAEPLSLLVLGDSLSAGYGLPQAQAFPSVLEQRLINMGWKVKVRNAGVSGDTSAGGLARLTWVLTPRPDAVIVELGANDALRGLPPRSTDANLRAIVRTLADKKIPTLLVGMKAPRNLGDSYSMAFDAIYPAIARDFDLVFYPFFLEKVALDLRYMQADGMHPNADGVRRIVNDFLPQAGQLLERAKPPKSPRRAM